MSRLRDSLRAHYERWRVLTEAEGAAIAASDWQTVDELHRTKRQLQTLITNATRELREEGDRRGLAVVDIEKEFRPGILKLLDMERANEQVLAARRKRVARKREQVDQIIHKLRNLRQAYVHTGPSLWETYS
jgi:type I site-specific restriction endonuclease